MPEQHSSTDADGDWLDILTEEMHRDACRHLLDQIKEEASYQNALDVLRALPIYEFRTVINVFERMRNERLAPVARRP